MALPEEVAAVPDNASSLVTLKEFPKITFAPAALITFRALKFPRVAPAVFRDVTAAVLPVVFTSNSTYRWETGALFGGLGCA